MDEISLAFTATKTAVEIAKGMIGLSKDVAVQQKAAELLATISDLYDKIHNLQIKITEAERTADEWKEKALKREAWEKTKSDLIVYEPTPDVKVYISKNESSSSEQTEWYCKHCADIKMVPSTFQLTNHSAAGRDFSCHNCQFKFRIPENVSLKPNRPMRPRRGF